MRQLSYKGKTLGNACSVYGIYKKNTGRGFTSDVAMLSRVGKIQTKLQYPETLTDDDIELLNKVDTGIIVVNLYVALRQAGDPEAYSKKAMDVANEITMDDISDPELINVITELVKPKKV